MSSCSQSNQNIPQAAADVDRAVKPAPANWYNARDLTVEGKGWPDTESFFERLPGRARDIVNEKHWKHSQCSAGMAVRFVTDASSLSVRWDGYKDHAGFTGLDLYVRHEGVWRWVSVATATQSFTEKELFAGLPVQKREYMLYLPLFHQLQRVELGVSSDCHLEPAAVRPQKPIVFYGTSITQGSRASRAGMPYCSILGRKLDWPVINLGFSGNGTMEPRFMDLLCELDPAVFVIDCLPNMTAPLIDERLVPAVMKLRAARATTPIVLVDMAYGDAFLKPDRNDRCTRSNQAQATNYKQLVSEGVSNLHHIEGDDVIGADGEGTIDGTHYTDLGYMRYAEKLHAPLQSILRMQQESSQ